MGCGGDDITIFKGRRDNSGSHCNQIKILKMINFTVNQARVIVRDSKECVEIKVSVNVKDAWDLTL